MLEPQVLVPALLVILFAGVTQSMTGFGFGLVAIPILTQIVEPRLALPVVMLNSLLLNLMILREYFSSIQLSRISVLSLASLVGSPIGVWILANADVDLMRIYIGILTCGAAVLALLGVRRVIQRELLASVPVGFVSGVMSGSTGMGGPPVIMFFNNQAMPRITFRANLVAYFLALQVVGLSLMTSAGILTLEAFASGIVLVPALILGGIAGSRLARKVDDAWVSRVTLMIVLFAGAISILNGMGFP